MLFFYEENTLRIIRVARCPGMCGTLTEEQFDPRPNKTFKCLAGQKLTDLVFYEVLTIIGLQDSK